MKILMKFTQFALILAALGQSVCAYLPDQQAIAVSPSSPLVHQAMLRKRTLEDKPEYCFNCLLTSDKCINYGTCDTDNGYCVCPAGFGGYDCKKALCGSLPSANRPTKPDPTQPCQCDDGWSGMNCNVCTQNESCRKMVDAYVSSNTSAVCYHGRKLVEQSFSDCQVKNTKLLNLLSGRPVDATFECEKAGNTCRMEFWVSNQEAFQCKFTDCRDVQFSKPSYNSTSMMCNKAECECIANQPLCGADGLIDLTELLAEVKGPATLLCQDPGFDNGRYNCQFSEPVFRDNLGPILGENPVVEIQCLTGECLHASKIPGHVEPDAEPSLTNFIIIVTLGVAALLSSVGLMFWLIVKHRKDQMYQAIGTDDIDGETEKLMEGGHHVPATLSFRGISYDISMDSGYKRVLRSIHGIVKPGEVMAIMGSSGAGKTTCLDILAGKTKRGIVTGDILINGAKTSRDLYKRISGYVDQEDAMINTLTVYETLLYSALLRLPRTMSLKAKEKRVQDTMEELGISHIANSRVGSGGHRGISGGEKRRVAIAMELVTSPSIIFLDEPTSGLDSYNALTVVQSLVTLAKDYNRTVILTIHQPRSNIFAMFDRLLLLAEGGFMIYSGPVFSPGSMSAVSDKEVASQPVLSNWLTALGVDCPPGYNLADYLIDLTKTGGFEEVAAPDAHLNGSHSSSKSSLRRRLSPTRETHKKLSNEHLAIPLSSDDDAVSAGKGSSNDSTRKSPGKHRMRTLAPSPIARRFADLPDQISVNQSDITEATLYHPQIVHLITGFVKSDVCRDVQIEINDSMNLASPALSPQLSPNNVVPSGILPSSASIHGTSFSVPFYPQSNDTEDENASLLALPPRSIMPVPYHIDTSYTNVHAPLPSDFTSLKPSPWTQFRVLSARSFVNFYRNPYLMLGHYTLSVVTAVICGVLFWKVTNDVSGFQNRLGVMFFQLTLLGLSSLSVLELFAKDRIIFVRERAGGFYSVTIYFITKVLFDVVPLRVVPPILLSCISYYMIGLVPDSAHFFRYVFAMVLFNLTTASICLVIAVSVSELGVANLLGVVTMLFSMLFSGFLLNKVNLSSWISWILYISPFSYALEAVLGNEMKDISLIDRQLGIPIQVPGSVLMNAFGLDPYNYWPDVTYLGVLFVSFLGIAFVIMQLFVRERR